MQSLEVLTTWHRTKMEPDTARLSPQMQTILVTGSQGLIGRPLTRRLREEGYQVVGYDISSNFRDDVLDLPRLTAAALDCSGIVHLAAVSRVIHGEANPARCYSVNVQGTSNILAAARTRAGGSPPWILYASSREVYGQAQTLPVSESAGLHPINTYARSKVQAEQLVASSMLTGGLLTSIVRFSNVYGSTHDHQDRVVPAFARGAAQGGTLRVDGTDNLLDFTYVEDVIDALTAMIKLLAGGEALPTLHLTSGEGTSLLELAQLAIQCAGKGTVHIARSRDYDVSSFVGDPSLAKDVLGWTASTPLTEGMNRLVTAFSIYELPRL